MKICVFLIVIASISIVSGALSTFGDPAPRVVSAAINNFTYNFYKSLADKESGNLICSPFSVDILLSMTNFGARGDTGKQLESSLNFPSDRDIAKRGFQQFIRPLNNVQGVELKLANKIFITNDATLQPDFQEITKTYFESETQSVDFKTTDETAQVINDWSAEKTHNCITKIVEPDEIDGATIVLVNAVYFKGKWANKFNPEYTTSSPFYIDNKTTKNVPTMNQWGFFQLGYLTDIKATYVELPYESKDQSEPLSMFIILPDPSTALHDVENNIHKVNFAELRGSKDEIYVSLPKFKIESKFDVKPTLKNMGITEIFEKTANLSGIISNANLKVTKIIQKALIEVNEEGSEAAAVTGIMGVELSAPTFFTVERPFLYAMVRKSSRTPLFMGRVIDPTILS